MGSLQGRRSRNRNAGWRTILRHPVRDSTDRRPPSSSRATTASAVQAESTDSGLAPGKLSKFSEGMAGGMNLPRNRTSRGLDDGTNTGDHRNRQVAGTPGWSMTPDVDSGTAPFQAGRVERVPGGIHTSNRSSRASRWRLRPDFGRLPSGRRPEKFLNGLPTRRCRTGARGHGRRS